MRATNFTWRDAIHVRLGDTEYDLHNDFDFRKVSYEPSTQRLLLEWVLRLADQASDGLPSQLMIHFDGVTRFSFAERDSSLPFSEDACLASFGYVSDADGINGQFWLSDQPDEGWRWSFIFQSGAEIRVAGDTATIDAVHN